jgi:hypothetical protein
MVITAQDIAEERVSRGVELLNAKVANWRQRINVHNLEMEDCMRCVLGQVFRKEYHDGGFIFGLEMLGIPLGDDWRYGFDTSPQRYQDEEPEYNDLLLAWKKHL